MKEQIILTRETCGLYSETLSVSWYDGILTVTTPYKGAFGLGERYRAFNLKGRSIKTEVEEHFCFQGDKTYCPVPFFWLDTGIGLWADTFEVLSFHFLEGEIRIEIPENIPVHLFFGSPGDIISAFLKNTGQIRPVPGWVFGPWISAHRWNSQKRVEETMEKLEKYDFPCSVMVLEQWSDEATFYLWNGTTWNSENEPVLEDMDFSQSPWPDPKRMVDDLHAKSIHLLLWQIPVFKQMGPDENPNIQNIMDEEYAINNGLVVKNADGTPYHIPAGRWFGGSCIPDFTNPDTNIWWFSRRQYLLDMGIDGFKTDGGEFIYSDAACFCNGLTGKQGKNAYPLWYEKSYTDFVGESRILFSRAGYAGFQTVPAHWAGDQQSVNEEFRSVLKAGLSAAASGMVLWGFDIGGFAGRLPSKDLYLRATQMACFCPIMQWHSEPEGGQFKDIAYGMTGMNERSPWNIADKDEPYLSQIRFWHNLRMKLAPWLVSCFETSRQTGIPFFRPLVMDFPEDTSTHSLDSEFLLGDGLLVAPWLEENETSRSVYLPEGTWIELFGRGTYEGRQSIEIYGQSRIPVFVKKDCVYEAFLLHLGETND